MQLQFTSDGKGFSLSLKGTWRSMRARAKVVIIIVIVIVMLLGLLTMPEAERIVRLLFG